MVGAGLPERVVTAHAVIADQGILQGMLEGMPHMQGAGDIRRWQHDAVAVALRRCTSGKIAIRFPLGIPVLLNCVRLVTFSEFAVRGFHRGCHISNSGLKRKAGHYTGNVLKAYW